MEKFEGNNSAVIRALYVIALDYLTYIPNSTSFDFEDLTIASGEQFEAIEFTHQTAKWAEKGNKAKGGNYFKKEVNCSIPCVRNEISDELINYENRPLAAIVTDENGYNWLVYPLHLLIDSSLPGTASAWNGYDLSFTGESSKRSPEITSLTIDSEEV